MSALMLHAFSLAPLASETPKEQAAKTLLAKQVKAGISELGTGASSRVRVVLDDKTRYDGYVTEIADDHFVVADARTGATAPIAYREVKGIKGHNLSKGASIGIGVAVAAAAGIAIAVAAGRNNNRVSNDSPCTRSAQIGVPCPPGCICAQ
jgi:hypothetical protein